MKNMSLEGRLRNLRFLLFISLVTSIVVVSCDPESNNLGVGIFPPNDTIKVYTDTITNMEVMLVESRPRITSASSSTGATRLFLLGSKVDTMTGLSKAEIVTQYANVNYKNFGDNTLIDSIMLSLYFSAIEGDTTQEMRIQVYELTDSISYDETYYSDFDISGKYNPVPIVDEVIIPKPYEVFEFDITDADYYNKMLEAVNSSDTLFTSYTNIKDVFPGLYITTEAVSSGGSIAKVQLGSDYSGVHFQYLHDSIDADTATSDDYDVCWLSFYNPNHTYVPSYRIQQFNIFKHDYTGTYIASIIGDSTAHPEICYVQGMAGVNTKVNIPGLDRYLDSGMVAINAANLIFNIVTDSISGIIEDDYLDQLLMINQLDDTTYQVVYDFITGSDSHYFGKLTQSNELSAFYDPIYFYNFHIGRHIQSIFAGEDLSCNFLIYPENALTTSKIMKIWSNYSDHEGGMKLELIYTKF